MIEGFNSTFNPIIRVQINYSRENQLGIGDQIPSGFDKGGNYPVEKVSWNNCQEFCEKLSDKTELTFSLPSEVQWEYDCRAGTRTPFYYGETLSTDIANYDGNSTHI